MRVLRSLMIFALLGKTKRFSSHGVWRDRVLKTSLGVILLLGAVQSLWAQEGAGVTAGPSPSDLQLKADLNPVEFGFRYDDNAFKSVDASVRLADEVYLFNGGCRFSAASDVFKGTLGYQLGADQYQFYSTLDNTKNDFSLSLDAEPGDWDFSYHKEYYLRNSQFDEFNYWDDDNLLDAQWSPSGPWSFEAKGRYFSRNYYSGVTVIQSQNFTDQGGLFGVQREIDEKFSVKLEGSYNNRQFNRAAVGLPDQTDETWSVLFNAHIYFEGILQDVNLEQERTDSNTSGFSNTVQSVSWAAVVRPSTSFYLQLLFRLFSKSYDVPPPTSPGLQIGFIDEDSQDILSLKASWEFSPQWMADLNASRLRYESTQPGQFYIENLIGASVQRNF